MYGKESTGTGTKGKLQNDEFHNLFCFSNDIHTSLAVKEFGHLLTCFGLIGLKVSLKVVLSFFAHIFEILNRLGRRCHCIHQHTESK
jgi:hypothetical protein